MLNLKRLTRAKDGGDRNKNVEIYISEHIRNDKLQNDYIQKKIGIAPIEEKMTKTKLQ